jgi:hypothetical protein
MPVVAFLLAISTGVDVRVALAFTLYAWVLVSVILATVAFGGLIVRLIGRGMRALRR